MCVQFLIVLIFAWFVLLDCLWQLWVLFEYRIELIVSNFCLFVSLCCDNSGLLSTVMTRVLFWCLCRASLWPYLGMSSVKDIFKDKFVDHAVPQSLELSDRHTKTRQTHQLLNAHWQWQGWLVLIVMLVLKSTCKSTMLSICVATIVLLHLCCSLWLLSFSIIVHLCCSFVLFICVVVVIVVVIVVVVVFWGWLHGGSSKNKAKRKQKQQQTRRRKTSALVCKLQMLADCDRKNGKMKTRVPIDITRKQ